MRSGALVAIINSEANIHAGGNADLGRFNRSVGRATPSSSKCPPRSRGKWASGRREAPVSRRQHCSENIELRIVTAQQSQL